ncbi:MAG: hypothetical protein CMB81_03470 [Flammeovirgaceae bacterium]|jgi:hypothetical protein|nr:hypothetical protein [Flammeovirgaceae bacterium]|tara:strand:+ start:6598 stop:7683 length:1086 start_codon:yes stop_codon:yes gene_type:complete
MFSIIKFLIKILLFFSIISCGNNTNKSREISKSFLPNASGENNEMLIVMDSSTFQRDVGRFLVNTYGSFVSGLPQPEKKFDLRYIRPRSFNSILKHAKNIVVAFTLDGKGIDSDILRKNFNENSLKRMKNDTSLYYFTRRDQYAKGQIVLYLFGKSEKLLLRKIKSNKHLILKYFDDEVKKRVWNDIFRRQEDNIVAKIYEDHSVKIKIPFGYDLAKNLPDSEGNFFWLRQLEPDSEKNIFVYYEDFYDYKWVDFGSVRRIREKISKKFLTDSENKKVFMTLQDVFPIEYKDVLFKNNRGVEAVGLWKLSDLSAGGPFKSYILYDETKKRAYYIEGYVFAPGQKKRNLMQEINSILNTFEI